MLVVVWGGEGVLLRSLAEATKHGIPALVGHGSWERLQRFAVTSQFSTLTAAAEHLGRGVAVTGADITRLEKDFSERLLVQKPLRCSGFGEDVLTTAHRFA